MVLAQYQRWERVGQDWGLCRGSRSTRDGVGSIGQYLAAFARGPPRAGSSIRPVSTGNGVAGA
eukprot:2001425-Rhodomonas_salina.2